MAKRRPEAYPAEPGTTKHRIGDTLGISFRAETLRGRLAAGLGTLPAGVGGGGLVGGDSPRPLVGMVDAAVGGACFVPRE